MTTNNSDAGGAGDTKAAGADDAATKAAADAAAKKTADDSKQTDDKATADAAAKKTADDAAAKKTADEAAAKAAKKAPTQYALTVPAEVDTNTIDLKGLEALAREYDWTNDEAQQALNEHLVGLKARSERYLTELKNDPDYGGANLERTQVLAEAALNRVRPKGTPRGDALRALLATSGYRNNLEVASLLADLGKLMGEDTHVQDRGNTNGKGETDPAKKMYPNQA